MSEEPTLTDVLNHEADIREMLHRRTELLRECLELLDSMEKESFCITSDIELRDKIRAELGEG